MHRNWWWRLREALVFPELRVYTAERKRARIAHDYDGKIIIIKKKSYTEGDATRPLMKFLLIYYIYIILRVAMYIRSLSLRLSFSLTHTLSLSLGEYLLLNLACTIQYIYKCVYAGAAAAYSCVCMCVSNCDLDNAQHHHTTSVAGVEQRRRIYT